MNNPYEVLGIGPNSSIQDIKNAYRNAVRMNQSSAASDEEKMRRSRELDEAYDILISGFSGSDTYSSYQGSQYGDVRNCLNANRIDDAETILNGVPQNMRNAEWYYLKGSVHQRRGWLNEAYKNYQQAYNMEPGNPEYANAFNYMNNNVNGGYRVNRNSDSSGCCDNDCCSCLCDLWCCDSICECFGGDLIPCC
ncbi:MAG: J domain-containing protein [Clostridiales bacterium]|nr:J domain-containing protein [Clostridiales bacterium]